MQMPLDGTLRNVDKFDKYRYGLPEYMNRVSPKAGMMISTCEFVLWLDSRTLGVGERSLEYFRTSTNLNTMAEIITAGIMQIHSLYCSSFVIRVARDSRKD